MSRLEINAVAFLRVALPEAWDRAAVDAEGLWRRIEYLSWPQRARVLDDFFWTRARIELTAEEVTAVINREAGPLTRSPRISAFARYCRAVVTAVLGRLPEQSAPTEAPRVLTWLLSRLPRQKAAAGAWLRVAAPETLRSALIGLPGYAFLLLTLDDSDSVLSLVARDAFRAATLGRC
jgi:hypothetical protein